VAPVCTEPPEATRGADGTWKGVRCADGGEGIPLPAFERYALEQLALKRDALCGTGELRVEACSAGLRLADGGQAFTTGGVQTLLTYTGIPRSVGQFLLDRGYHGDLARYVNDALERRCEAGKRAYVRFRRIEDVECVRAVLTEDYTPIDFSRTLEILRSALAEDFERTVLSHCWDDGDTYHFGAILPGEKEDFEEGKWCFGLWVRDSEVGSSAFQAGGIARHTCGAHVSRQDKRASESVYQVHSGRVDFTMLTNRVRRAAGRLEHFRVDLERGVDLTRKITVDRPQATVAAMAQDLNFTREKSRAWWAGCADLGISSRSTAFEMLLGLGLGALKLQGLDRAEAEAAAGRISFGVGADARWKRARELANHLDGRVVESLTVR
jgi:hypothetical protein